MRTHAAQTIVNAVFDELAGRKGLDWEFDAILDDPEVYQEMYEACVQKVQDAWQQAAAATLAGTESDVKLSRFFPEKSS